MMFLGKLNIKINGCFSLFLRLGLRCFFINDYVSILDEEEDVANESDSSPPQSKGRGRFEKGRNKLGSHGQSEDGCSTSSQGADEERSSHVRPQAPSLVW